MSYAQHSMPFPRMAIYEVSGSEPFHPVSELTSSDLAASTIRSSFAPPNLYATGLGPHTHGRVDASGL